MKFQPQCRAEDPLQFRAMILVTAAAFILFWLRDYWLLQLGSARNVVWRAWVYTVFVSFAGLLVWMLASARNTAELVSELESTPLIIGLFAFHSIAAVACFWMKRTGRYDLAWLAAIVPAPVAWVLFARVVFTADDATVEPWKGAVILVVASLMIAPVLTDSVAGSSIRNGCRRTGLCSRVRRLDQLFRGRSNCASDLSCCGRIFRGRHPRTVRALICSRVLSTASRSCQ